MNRWTVAITRPAEKDLEDLPIRDQAAVERRLDQIEQDPFDTDIRRVQGAANIWRVRASDWRIILELDLAARVATVLRIRHRREAYRS